MTNKFYSYKTIVKMAKTLKKDELKIVVEKLTNHLQQLDGMVNFEENLIQIKQELAKNYSNLPKNKKNFLNWLKNLFSTYNYSQQNLEQLFDFLIETEIIKLNEDNKIIYIFNPVLENPQIIYENILKKMPITQRPKLLNNLVEFIYQKLNQTHSKTNIKKMLHNSKLLSISSNGEVFYFIKK